MNNAEKFEKHFGKYATEVWAMPEQKFLEWLNSEATDRTAKVEDTWRVAGFETLNAWCPECEHRITIGCTYCPTCGVKLDWGEHGKP